MLHKNKLYEVYGYKLNWSKHGQSAIQQTAIKKITLRSTALCSHGEGQGPTHSFSLSLTDVLEERLYHIVLFHVLVHRCYIIIHFIYVCMVAA